MNHHVDPHLARIALGRLVVVAPPFHFKLASKGVEESARLRREERCYVHPYLTPSFMVFYSAARIVVDPQLYYNPIV